MQKLLALVFLVVGTVASWLAWLAWDDTYQVDVHGVASGPYETWQVVGSGITVIVVVFLAARFLSPWIIAPVAGISYAAAWGWTLIPQDDTGLAGVGLIMTLAGVTIGALLIALMGGAIWGRLGRSRRVPA